MKSLTLSISALALAAVPGFAQGYDKPDHGEMASSSGAEAQETGTIVETAQAAGSFTTLITAAKAAGLAGALNGDGPLTVFAPTDAAFAALPDGTVETLLKPENVDQLAGILKLHVVSGKVTSDQLAGKVLDVETLGGTVSVDGTDGVSVDGATVTQADIMASNGVIHVIDTVILPDG
jgi:uncharacterized surface protein with fasciclin (FAS1) repeats